jgi:hypothetical protein
MDHVREKFAVHSRTGSLVIAMKQRMKYILFVVYLTTLSLAHTIQRRMIG